MNSQIRTNNVINNNAPLRIGSQIDAMRVLNLASLRIVPYALSPVSFNMESGLFGLYKKESSSSPKINSSTMTISGSSTGLFIDNILVNPTYNNPIVDNNNILDTFPTIRDNWAGIVSLTPNMRNTPNPSWKMELNSKLKEIGFKTEKLLPLSYQDTFSDYVKSTYEITYEDVANYSDTLTYDLPVTFYGKDINATPYGSTAIFHDDREFGFVRVNWPDDPSEPTTPWDDMFTIGDTLYWKDAEGHTGSGDLINIDLTGSWVADLTFINPVGTEYMQENLPVIIANTPEYTDVATLTSAYTQTKEASYSLVSTITSSIPYTQSFNYDQQLSLELWIDSAIDNGFMDILVIYDYLPSEFNIGSYNLLNYYIEAGNMIFFVGDNLSESVTSDGIYLTTNMGTYFDTVLDLTGTTDIQFSGTTISPNIETNLYLPSFDSVLSSSNAIEDISAYQTNWELIFSLPTQSSSAWKDLVVYKGLTAGYLGWIGLDVGSNNSVPNIVRDMVQFMLDPTYFVDPYNFIVGADAGDETKKGDETLFVGPLGDNPVLSIDFDNYDPNASNIIFYDKSIYSNDSNSIPEQYISTGNNDSDGYFRIGYHDDGADYFVIGLPVYWNNGQESAILTDIILNL